MPENFPQVKCLDFLCYLPTGHVPKAGPRKLKNYCVTNLFDLHFSLTEYSSHTALHTVNKILAFCWCNSLGEEGSAGVINRAARSQEFSRDLQRFHILSRLSQDHKIFVKISRIIKFLLQNALKKRKFHKI